MFEQIYLQWECGAITREHAITAFAQMLSTEINPHQALIVIRMVELFDEMVERHNLEVAK